MKSTTILKNSLPMLAAGIAALALLLTPIWAFQWYRTPFIGAFIEPNMVVSQINGADWPARQSGAQLGDRLLLVNGAAVGSARELMAALDHAGDSPTALTFARRGEPDFTITVTPRPVRPGELFAQFGVAYLAGVALLASGMWAYRLAGTSRPARAYLLFTAAGSVVTSSFLDMNTTHNFTLGWTVAIPILGGAMGYLALVFPQATGFVNRRPITRFLPWAAALPVALWGAGEIILPSSPWGYVQAWLAGYITAALGIMLFVGMLVFRVARGETAIVRQQSRIMIFGATLAFGPIVLLYLIPSALGQQPEFVAALYFPPILIFLLSVAYAIVRYRLLDADRFLSRAVTYLLTSAVALLAFYLVLTLLSLLLEATVQASDPLVVAVYLFVLVALFNPLRAFMQKAVDRLFYRTQADYRAALAALSRQLAATPDLPRTLLTLESRLGPALLPERLLLYLYDDEQRLYLPHSNQPHAAMPLTPRNGLVRLLDHSAEALWLPSSRPFSGELADTGKIRIAGNLPEQLGCIAFVPLRYEGRLTGFLALGPRRSGEPYSREDLDFLDAAAGQSSLALENVRLFANLRRTLDETREMKNLMDDIFASIASGVITTDLGQKITLFNQSAERILGLPRAQAVGQTLASALSALSPGLDQLAAMTITQNVITLGAEFSPKLPEKGEINLRLSAAPLRDAHAETKGAAFIVEDLTEQRRVEAEREHIHQTFGRVVAPSVRDQLLSHTSYTRLSSGIRQLVTVMFADLHGFTSLSERTDAAVLFDVLNSYLALAADAVLEEQGTLDKFLGDAVLALWNAPDPQPDHTLRAVRAAQKINQRLGEHLKTLDPKYHLSFSIGITRGEAMVGNVGTSEMFNFTAIGDTVNLAQRLEATAEPGQILITGEVYRALGGQVNARQLPAIHVKGREQAVEVWAVD